MNLSYSPCCVRVDKLDNSVYVAGNQLYKYSNDGTIQWSAELDEFGGFSLAIDSERMGAWVGTATDVRLISFEGDTVLTIDEFPGVDQKYVFRPSVKWDSEVG